MRQRYEKQKRTALYLNCPNKNLFTNDTKGQVTLMASFILWVELNPCIDSYGASGPLCREEGGWLFAPGSHYFFSRQEK